MCKVSIIIPCYNQGNYVEEALASALKQTYPDFEVVIVNDGSSDQYTADLLSNLNFPNVRVLHTENKGLAAARNNGIAVAVGKYILPLDADDLIELEYLKEAVCVLEQRENVGIVYCRAKLFGAVDTEWLLPPYSLSEMLLDNVIFCSAMFRKSDWKDVGGYDSGMIYGWEDYDFWLSLIEQGREVYQIPQILFSYRVASDSMVRSKEKWQKVSMFKRIFERHKQLFADNIEVWINALLEVREPYCCSKLYVDTGGGVSEAECISRKVELGTSEIQFSLVDYKGIQAIRFDPIDTPAIVEIFTIIVTSKQGERREFFDYTDNSILQIKGDRYFETDDPQCFIALPQSELESLDTLTVKLSFKALADDALQQIVKLQQDKLQTVSSTIRRYESLGIMKAVGQALQQRKGEGRLQYIKRQLNLS